MRAKTVRLASSEVAVSYPASLDSWFDGVVEPRDESVAQHKWVRLAPNRKPDHFDVLASINPAAGELRGLDLGEALAMFWERVSFLLMEDLCGDIVLGVVPGFPLGRDLDGATAASANFYAAIAAADATKASDLLAAEQKRQGAIGIAADNLRTLGELP
jgi:hypothetical protein